MLSSIRTRNKRTFVFGYFPSLRLLRQYLEATLEDERNGLIVVARSVRPPGPKRHKIEMPKVLEQRVGDYSVVADVHQILVSLLLPFQAM